ncbi:MAG: Camphor 5-monooxygenase [Acidimicrobiia bacterium]|nr:Camphor 5-monooxygenase [Acidimicrobiia bacterium]
MIYEGSGSTTLIWADPPDHVPADVVIKFDHCRDPGVNAQPWETTADLRSKPIWWSQAPPINQDSPGSWIPTRAEDIRYVFQHPEIFSSDNPKPLPGSARLIPIELDPPDHTKYRQLIAAAFSPNAVRRLEPEIRRWAGELIDTFVGDGQCEFIHQFAQPYPTALFCGIMGIPFEKIDEFLVWNRIIIHGSDMPLKQQTVIDVSTYFAGLIVERRANPQDDLISHLVQSKVDGELLDVPMLVNMSILLFMAGLDTVTASVGWAIQYLATHPEQRDRLVADPSLIPLAMEEMLRYYAIVNPPRYAVQDVELAGVTIKRGDMVQILTSLGTRDPVEFEGADIVDFDRHSNRHMAFGLGPHRCVGSHLARDEAVIALQELLARLPNFRIPDGESLPSHAGPVYGIDRLPLVWDRR